MSSEEVTPDPTALRALSHPVRLRMLGLLRSEGPSTASRLAERLGLNSGATSYHLRNLAQHGFVVDAPERGNGRDRWWQAAQQRTTTDNDAAADKAEARDAIDAFAQAIAVVHTEQLQRAVEERPLLPAQWWRTTSMSDWGLQLRTEDAMELREQLHALVESFAQREVPAGTEDSGQMVYQIHAFPRPGTVAPEAS
jgi:predicted ArsR family transcriptional regulator